jgi:ketosteroid isomerase-like protein
MKKLKTPLTIALVIIAMAVWNNPSLAKRAIHVKPDTVAFNIERARSAVMEMDKKIQKAFENGDVAGIAAFVSADAATPVSNSNATWGRAARAGGKDIRFTVDRISGNRGLLVESGKYEVYGNQNQLIARGKYVREWKPVNGNWKLVNDNSTSDQVAHKKCFLYRWLGFQ